jgi:hypothetical protein
MPGEIGTPEPTATKRPPGWKRDVIMASVGGLAFGMIFGILVGWGAGLIGGVLTGIVGFLRARQMAPFLLLLGGSGKKAQKPGSPKGGLAP